MSRSSVQFLAAMSLATVMLPTATTLAADALTLESIHSAELGQLVQEQEQSQNRQQAQQRNEARINGRP